MRVEQKTFGLIGWHQLGWALVNIVLLWLLIVVFTAATAEC